MAENELFPPAGAAPLSPSDALRRILALRPYLMAFIVSMLRDVSVAERIFQDICAEMGQKSSAPPERDAFALWACEVARRRTLAVLKAREKSGALMPPEAMIKEVEAVISQMMASPQAPWNRRKEVLRTCLKELPSRLRKIIDLRYLQNLSAEKIAEQLGEEHDRVLEALNQARLELQVCLQRRMGERS